MKEAAPRPISIEDALAILGNPNHPQHQASKHRVDQIVNEPIRVDPFDVQAHRVDPLYGRPLPVEGEL